jgi:polyisoprenoid-binding protein YceI
MSATTWKLDPAHTQVEFSVKHMMFTTVRGQFSRFEGVVELDRDDSTNSSVEVSIDTSSIDTGVEDRDAHLRSKDFFDVEAYPEIIFRSTRVEGSVSEDGTFEIVGDLTVRGVTREVTLTAEFGGTGTDPWGGTRVGFEGKTVIDRRDFGLTWNQALETGGFLVGNDIKISLQVQAVLQEEAVAV